MRQHLRCFAQRPIWAHLDVWRETKAFSGISYKFYRKYYKGKKTAVAYKIGMITQFAKPKQLTEFGITHPPQSFAYLRESVSN
jgi:predicted transcriptional regulator